MARKPKQEPKPVQADIGDTYAEEVEESEDKLWVGKLRRLRYEPGTMSAPAFVRFVLETETNGELEFETSGKLAGYISLLSNGERLGVFVRDEKIVGVA